MSSCQIGSDRRPSRTAGEALLWGTLTTAMLDGLEAAAVCALRGIEPQRAFQAIAAGLLGRPAAFAGGAATTALGVGLLLFICAVITAVYLVASRRLIWLRERPWRWGAAYGATVFVVMNFVVAPLSRAAPAGPRQPLLLANCLAACILCVGIPAALFARAAGNRTAGQVALTGRSDFALRRGPSALGASGS